METNKLEIIDSISDIRLETKQTKSLIDISADLFDDLEKIIEIKQEKDTITAYYCFKISTLLSISLDKLIDLLQKIDDLETNIKNSPAVLTP